MNGRFYVVVAADDFERLGPTSLLREYWAFAPELEGGRRLLPFREPKAERGSLAKERTRERDSRVVFERDKVAALAKAEALDVDAAKALVEAVGAKNTMDKARLREADSKGGKP